VQTQCDELGYSGLGVNTWRIVIQLLKRNLFTAFESK